jgi:tetratricopeptide (TPR) repeat protein
MRKSVLLLWTVLVLALSLPLIDCRHRPVAAHVPAVNVQDMVEQGDTEFQKSHLYGWRRAEAHYSKAYGLDPSDALRGKLLLTRFLIITRELDEDIADTEMERKLGESCSGRLNARQQMLCDLAVRHRAGSAAAPSEPEGLPDASLLDVQNSPLDAYLYTLYLQIYGIAETDEMSAARAERFKDSPLFVYLNLGKKIAERGKEIEVAVPDFAELFDFMGGVQFQQTLYSKARSHFKKALDLLPDYTRSLNGLGNICLFALEDNEGALEYYQSSLKWNPGNAAALYGTGIVLHNLGKYAESNIYLDRMLQSDIARGGHTGGEAVRYYLGEANYYKAYNFHLMGDPQRAREFVEAAKAYLPNSDHVNYLSALLYYQNSQLRSARDDFMRVVQSGAPNCDAQYYLGRIYRESNEDLDEKPPEQTSGVHIPERLAEYLKQVPRQKEPKEKRSLDYFLAACSCMERNIGAMKTRIQSVPSMDLEEAERTVLRERLQAGLRGYRRSSASLIDIMLAIASSSDLSEKDVYLNPMKEVQERVREGGDGEMSPQTRSPRE